MRGGSTEGDSKDALTDQWHLVSIMIPTYNEVSNIGILIEKLEALPFRKEIIVIDDGSSDGTVEVVKNLMRRYNNIKLLLRPRRMGIGSAYRDGLKLATGKIVAQLDADLSHRPEDLPGLVEELMANCLDVVIGSRYVKGGATIGWPFYRYALSYGMCLLARLLLRLRVRDSLSGYKVYRRPVYEFLTAKRKADGFADFEIEMVYLAKKYGLKVKEVPIVFKNRETGSSKISILDIISVLKSVLRLCLQKR